jgi:uncharacterized repeat protein (TIGR01451 family)
MMARLVTSIIAIIMALIGVSAQAATPLQLSSDVFVEKQVVRADGSRTVVLEKPNLVLPGDNLVFVVKYRNTGPTTANNFVVTNPLPTAVAFNGTSDGLEVVSIDGGNVWGILETLRVKQANGTLRAAERRDVTHIKWNLRKAN